MLVSSIFAIAGLGMFALAAMLVYSYRTPSWAKAPCSSCGNSTAWAKGQQHAITGEALFTCSHCGNKEFRGGSYSESAMEHTELH